MKLHEVKKLNSGDTVHWEDPDNNIASGYFVVGDIQINGEIIGITTTGGCYFECFAHELS